MSLRVLILCVLFYPCIQRPFPRILPLTSKNLFIMCVLGTVFLRQVFGPGVTFIAWYAKTVLCSSLAYARFALALFQFLKFHSLSYRHLDVLPEVLTVSTTIGFLCSVPSPILALGHLPPGLFTGSPRETGTFHSAASMRWHAGKKRSSTGRGQITGTELQALGKDIKPNHIVRQIFSSSRPGMENQKIPWEQTSDSFRSAGWWRCQRCPRNFV